MKSYRTMVVKYGYAVIEADSEEEALEKTKDLDERSFDWSEPCNEQVVEEVDL